MDTGMYLQNFGDITVWPRAETFYFTADGEGGSGDASIRVQFNDGSFCNISGSMRVTMPPDATKALGLVTINNFKTYDQLEHELILKITRNALMLTANLMSSRESYAEKRPDFVFWAWDQIEHGQYETADEKVEETDAITKEKVTKIRKIIKHGPDGKPLRQRNQLEGLGITLGNFEIKTYGYEDKVVTQISDQQEAIMASVVIKHARHQLGLFMAVLAVSSAIILALIIYTLTMDKLREIATLKLIGMPDRSIIGLILQQALLMGVVGFVIGAALVSAAKDRFPRRVVVEPADLGILFGVVVVVCLLASVVAVRVAVRVDPARALAG